MTKKITKIISAGLLAYGLLGVAIASADQLSNLNSSVSSKTNLIEVKNSGSIDTPSFDGLKASIGFALGFHS